MKKKILKAGVVIDEARIRKAVRTELLTLHESGNVPSEDKVNLHEVTTLNLNYEGISAIDNLQGFGNLVKLQLSNNNISKIVNIDHLTKLKWLDLSFNNITQIEGLDKLVELTDLTLYHNMIPTLAGIDALTKLEVLSVGKNLVSSLDEVKALRRFPKLRLLNLKDNPVSAHEDYQTVACAFIPQLKYLDYKLIKGGQRKKARDKWLELMYDLEEKEKGMVAGIEEAKKAVERKGQLEQANLKGLYELFDSMFKNDEEQGKLKLLTGFDRIYETYRANFTATIDDLARDMLKMMGLKDAEVGEMSAAANEASEIAETKSKNLLQEFASLEKRNRGNVALLNPTLDKLASMLMDIEMLVVEQMASVLDEFAVTYTEMVRENVVRITSCFRSLGEITATYGQQMMELVYTLHEKAAKLTEQAEEKGVSVQSLGGGIGTLADKDVLNQAVSTSTESHVTLIIACEDAIRDREEKAGKELIARLRHEEYLRNRHRVQEIFQTTRHRGADGNKLPDATDDAVAGASPDPLPATLALATSAQLRALGLGGAEEEKKSMY